MLAMRIVRGTVLAGLVGTATWLGVMMLWQVLAGKPVAHVFTPIAHTFRKSVALDGRAGVSTVLVAVVAVFAVTMVFTMALEVIESQRVAGSGPWMVGGATILAGVFWVFTHMFAWNAADPTAADHLSKGGGWLASIITGAVVATVLLPARLPDERFFTTDPTSGDSIDTRPLPH
ncbi:hypothetical protein Lfu02_76480 [Longispora fulva]|nr:hypothetical protein Lfu02_76480 [Longispora fulva]